VQRYLRGIVPPAITTELVRVNIPLPTGISSGASIVLSTSGDDVESSPASMVVPEVLASLPPSPEPAEASSPEAPVVALSVPPTPLSLPLAGLPLELPVDAPLLLPLPPGPIGLVVSFDEHATASGIRVANK
jgi:hypothetical protein